MGHTHVPRGVPCRVPEGAERPTMCLTPALPLVAAPRVGTPLQSQADCPSWNRGPRALLLGRHEEAERDARGGRSEARWETQPGQTVREEAAAGLPSTPWA